MATIDPTLIVDRDTEMDRFATMLRGDTPERLLVLSGSSGTGKTHVLRKLRLQCRTKHEVPVAFVNFADGYSDDWMVITAIAQKLRDHDLSLPTFDPLDKARSRESASEFGIVGGSTVGAVHVGGAVSGGTVGGVIANDGAVVNIERRWTDEMERLARNECRTAFLHDLFELTDDQRVVLIFDHVERAEGQVGDFLFEQIFERTLRAPGTPARLYAVAAGQDLLRKVEGRVTASERDLIWAPTLETFTRQHIIEMLAAHRLDAEDVVVDAAEVLIKGGRPLIDAITMAKIFHQAS